MENPEALPADQRVWIFSLEARPSAPQAGHLIASTGIALLELHKDRPRTGRSFSMGRV